MRDTGTQLREYLDATAAAVSVAEIMSVYNGAGPAPADVDDVPPHDHPPEPGRIRRMPHFRPNGHGFWIALAAAIAIVVLIGIASRFFGTNEVVEQINETTATTLTAPTNVLGPVIPTDMTGEIAPGRTVPTAGTPPPNIDGAAAGDDGAGPLPLGAVGSLPNDDRLNFLFEF